MYVSEYKLESLLESLGVGIRVRFISSLHFMPIKFCVRKLLLVVLIFIGQRPAAIVSAFAGTTRDVLESALDIFGYPIVLRYRGTFLFRDSTSHSHVHVYGI